jgi:hypothetical protein
VCPYFPPLLELHLQLYPLQFLLLLTFSIPLHRHHLLSHHLGLSGMINPPPQSQWSPRYYPFPRQSPFLLQPLNYEKGILQLLRLSYIPQGSPAQSTSVSAYPVPSITPLTYPYLSLVSLAIMVPSIPEGGTKSRVETQVRVTVDLAYASATGGDLPSQYDRVGSWKWLKLPKGTATKKRTRKEGKIGPPFFFSISQSLEFTKVGVDPLVEDTLQLAVEITCASPPHSRVVCCSSCQGREVCRSVITIGLFH